MVAKKRPLSDDVGLIETDDPADANRRLCALTRAPRPREDLIRFVVAPDGTLTPDLSARLPGRGVWITADQLHISKAIKANAFSRSLKRSVEIPADLPQRLENLITTQALQALAMANKAGQAVCGFDKTNAVIDRGNAIALLHAGDASLGGQRKLNGKYRAISEELDRPSKILVGFKVDQLSLAMGRSNVVHAALTSGGAARKAIGLAQQLERYLIGIDEPIRPEQSHADAPP